MSDSPVTSQPVAYAFVDGGAGLLSGQNCTITRTGVGAYEMTLGREVDNNEMMMTLTVMEAGRGAIFVPPSTDSVKTINTFNTTTGALIDVNFFVKVEQFPKAAAP